MPQAELGTSGGLAEPCLSEVRPESADSQRPQRPEGRHRFCCCCVICALCPLCPALCRLDAAVRARLGSSGLRLYWAGREAPGPVRHRGPATSLPTPARSRSEADQRARESIREPRFSPVAVSAALLACMAGRMPGRPSAPAGRVSTRSSSLPPLLSLSSSSSLSSPPAWRGP